MFRQPPPLRRSPLVGVVSLLLHGALIAVVAVVGTRKMFAPHVDEAHPLTYLTFAPPHPPVEVPDVSAPAKKPMELPPHVAELTPIVMPAPQPVVTPPPMPEPVAPPPKVAAVIVPQRPQVTVGAFANTAAAPIVETKRQIQTAGFDAATAAAPDLKLKASAVGAFDSQPATAPRPGTDRAGVVAVGFEGTPGVQPQQNVPRAVANAGFGATAAQPQPNAPRAVASAGFGGVAAQAPQAPRAEVKPTGFGEVQPAAPAAAPARPKPDAGSQVEVIFKPTPAYTEDARAKKIEGDVVLEVDFTATNQVRVVRVVRGLGHGLDEMATQAAEKIRFKPALSGGKPVDVRATVTIVFRLA